jgi:hypothetical protein
MSDRSRETRLPKALQAVEFGAALVKKIKPDLHELNVIAIDAHDVAIRTLLEAGHQAALATNFMIKKGTTPQDCLEATMTTQYINKGQRTPCQRS